MIKKLLFLASMMLFSIVSSGQALIGYNMAEVSKKYPNEDWKYSYWDEKRHLQTMSYETEIIVVIYFFDENYLCFSTSIVPKDKGTLQGMIERYNNRYVIIDDTHWKFYTDGGILNCTLEQTDKGLYFFKWYE